MKLRHVFAVALLLLPAAARADDHVERDGGDGQRRRDGAKARRQAAFEEARAEFDAVGAGVLGGDEAINAFDADFDLERVAAQFSCSGFCRTFAALRLAMQDPVGPRGMHLEGAPTRLRTGRERQTSVHFGPKYAK